VEVSVSIIILNYNTTALLLNCIQSIYDHTTGISFEVIVVDNASPSSPEHQLAQRFPGVKHIQNTANNGFSRGNNLGVNAATGRYFSLLNSDTLLIENSFKKCVDFMENNQAQPIGLLGCKLLNADASLQKSFHWSAARFAKIIQANPIYNKLFKDRLARKHIQWVDTAHTKTGAVDWLAGAFFLRHRETALAHSFLLDEDFFMYFEDVELCRRINRNGYNVVYFTETALIHLGGGGTNVPLKRYKQILLSEWLCILKNYGRIGLLAYWFIWGINNILFKVLIYKNKLMKKKVANSDLRQQIMINQEKEVFNNYFFTLLLSYSKKTNSSKSDLKYHA
jgi:GT2 family glycosyltransferase